MAVVRGIRNNNPGNIRISSSNWKGKKKREDNTDGAFEQFVSMEFGVRALIVLVRNYIRGGHNTIEKIVNRYAPAHENPTNAYAVFISKQTGYSTTEVLAPERCVLYNLARAITEFECGKPVVDSELFDKAWALV